MLSIIKSVLYKSQGMSLFCGLWHVIYLYLCCYLLYRTAHRHRTTLHGDLSRSRITSKGIDSHSWPKRAGPCPSPSFSAKKLRIMVTFKKKLQLLPWFFVKSSFLLPLGKKSTDTNLTSLSTALVWFIFFKCINVYYIILRYEDTKIEQFKCTSTF